MNEDSALLRARLNLETGRIAWRDLQRFFAAGRTLRVVPGVSLVEVACAMASDDTAAVEAWTRRGDLAPVGDAQARAWFAADAELWSVVVKPWVLVQEVSPPST